MNKKYRPMWLREIHTSHNNRNQCEWLWWLFLIAIWGVIIYEIIRFIVLIT